MTQRTSKRQRLPIVLTVIVFVAIPVVRSRADALRPDELLLIYNGDDSDSRELAAYYAEQRGVPADRLFALHVEGTKEEIPAVDFSRLIRDPIRRHLEEHDLRDRVRCLVTFYGLPIRVGEWHVSGEYKALKAKWDRQFINALAELEHAVYELDAIATDIPPRRLATRPPSEEDYPKLLERYSAARAAAWNRLKRLSDADAAQKPHDRLLAVVQKVQGLSFLLPLLEQAAARQDEAASRQLQQVNQAVRQTEARIDQALAGDLADPTRDEARRWIRESRGLVGLLASLREDANRVRTDQTKAAVDSELTLIWWDRYQKYRWVPNTLNWQLRTDPERRARVPADYWDRPVLLASRIDASSPAVARRMIDHAVTAERTGLAGTVYIDARRLKRGQGHAEYDRDLRETAEMIRVHTELTIRLDNSPKLFAPGRCPEAMLYCGWYSLRKYVDAFDFVPGAVGFHVASFEAVSLKNPGERGWCKNLLEDGIAATLGPVAEPYLESFPPPEHFFGLLLTGRFSLAECYAYTKPFNSWMMMLLGDPLYRPFARSPHLTVEQAYEPEPVPPKFKSSPESQPAPSRPAG